MLIVYLLSHIGMKSMFQIPCRFSAELSSRAAGDDQVAAELEVQRGKRGSLTPAAAAASRLSVGSSGDGPRSSMHRFIKEEKSAICAARIAS